MAYAKTTDVPVARSRAEIESLVAKHDCRKFLSGIDHDKRTATIQFEAHNRIIKFEITLPDPKDPKWKQIKGRYLERNASGIARLVEQEERSRWRALLLVIKAKLEAVESGIATFEDEFLAHVLLPNQQTVAEWIGPRIAEVYESGRMPIGRQLTDGEIVEAEK